MEKWRGSGAVGGADSGYLHRIRREKKRGSKNVAHIRDNLDILDFALTEDEMAQIAALDKGVRYYHRTDEQLRQFAVVPDETVKLLLEMSFDATKEKKRASR